MQYVVRNLLSDGVESVGTNPLDADAAVWSASIRTGRPAAEIADSIHQLDPELVPAVAIPAGNDTANACAVRVEIVRDGR